MAQAREELLVMAERERIDRQKEAILARRRAAVSSVAHVAEPAPPAVGRPGADGGLTSS